MGKKRKRPGEPDRIEEYGSEKDDHVVVGVREVDRDTTSLRHVFDLRNNRWDRYTLKNVSTPPKTHLFNFDVPVGKLGNLVVLDNYGDEWMPDKIRKQILNTRMFQQTIGILRKTGEIVHVGFIKEKVHHPGCPEEGAPESVQEFYSLTFWDFGQNGAADPLFLPAAYMKRIDELKSMKRPFALTLWDNTLYSFITRWTGYDAFLKNIVIDFHFEGMRLQVWGDSWREVSEWKHHDNPRYKGKT